MDGKRRQERGADGKGGEGRMERDRDTQKRTAQSES